MLGHVRAALAIAIALAVTALAAAPAGAQYGAVGGEWRSYGGDVGSTKYSPLDQVTADNFEQLEIAWSWRSVDARLTKAEAGGSWTGPASEVFEALAAENPDLWSSEIYSRRPGTSLMTATPLMVDGILYISTPLYQAAAIDARTGETLWAYDPKASSRGRRPSCRGVTGVWRTGRTTTTPASCGRPATVT